MIDKKTLTAYREAVERLQALPGKRGSLINEVVPSLLDEVERLQNELQFYIDMHEEE